MKKKFDGSALGKEFAFFFTVFGWVVEFACYIAFREIYIPWVITSAVFNLLAIAAYIWFARIADSVDNFIHALLARHTVVSFCSFILSNAAMFAMNSLEGLIFVFISLSLIPLGYLLPAVHLIVRTIGKRRQSH